MSELSVMRPQEELQAATRIANLREAYWRSLLSYPPYIEGIVALIEDQLSAEQVPSALLLDIRRSSRSLRDRETRANQDAFTASAGELATKMAELDLDGTCSELIAADLNTLSAEGRDGLSMAVTPPRQGSRPFADYAQRVRKCRTALSAAKNDFIKSNLRLVVSIARRYNHGQLPLHDLIQEGNIGLMKAVDRYDHRKGFRFSTYGSWWIRHAISRAVADKGREVRLPVHMVDSHYRISRARREFELKHGKEPSTEELAEQTRIPASKIEKMAGFLLERPLSLDQPVHGEDGLRLADTLEDPDAGAPIERFEVETLSQEVRRLFRGLRPIEIDILHKRFGLLDDEEMTLKTIGAQYSLSRERIRQLQEQALVKIRRELTRREAV